MKEFKVTVPVEQYAYAELSDERRELVDAARRASLRAYAPYSKFHVGAAIRLADGTIVEGSNQENAAFSSGTCAERTACYYAGSTYPNTPFRAIAISAITPAGTEQALPIAPCGHCRQALLEYEERAGAPVEVILVGADAIYVLPSVKSLLPLAFTEF